MAIEYCVVAKVTLNKMAHRRNAGTTLASCATVVEIDDLVVGEVILISAITTNGHLVWAFRVACEQGAI
jgi:hypothetical protein